MRTNQGVTTFSWRNVHATIEWICCGLICILYGVHVDAIATFLHSDKNLLLVEALIVTFLMIPSVFKNKHMRNLLLGFLIGYGIFFLLRDVLLREQIFFILIMITLLLAVFQFVYSLYAPKKVISHEEQEVQGRELDLYQAYLRGVAFVIVLFYGLNWAIDAYIVPEFARHATQQEQDGKVVVKKEKGFGSFFKRKKKKPKKVKESEKFFDSTSQKEAVLSIGIKAALGGMLLLVSFLITLFALGIESIFIGWLLVCKACYQALMLYGLEVISPMFVIAGSIGIALLMLAVFLWMYIRTIL